MDAIKAKRISDEANEVEFQKVIEKIKSSAEKGLYDTDIGSVSVYTEVKLANLGYKTMPISHTPCAINYNDRMLEEMHTLVSWATP